MKNLSLKKKISVVLVLTLALGLNFTKPLMAADKAKAARPLSYRIDLDSDGERETIKVENRLLTDNDYLITISKKDKAKTKMISVPGQFREIEIIDLNEDGFNQIAIYYEDNNDYSNLVIYSLKNNKLIKVFAISNPSGIETDFKSVLARINTGNESWVWGGNKFIRER